MSTDQLRGAVILLVMATLIYGFRLASQHWSIATVSMPQTEKRSDTLTVELEGSKDCNGIYSLSPGSTVYDLFIVATTGHISRFNKKDLLINLHDGDKIIITTDDNRYSSVTVGRMGASTRYVLDMPININNATVEDLELIPGIGKKTAQAIVKYREMNGMFISLDDASCFFAKKKSGYFAKYLYVGESS
ncbi:MAG: helix-hairpin-helix domain-containing protein [Deltaproteobacteria bacterium]|nr:helix-hairpin-helix domain-containing protein [Deltaproteobacteria bacterium]